MQRKRTDTLRQWQEAYADLLLEEGNEVYVEDMNSKDYRNGLKRRKRIRKGSTNERNDSENPSEHELRHSFLLY